MPRRPLHAAAQWPLAHRYQGREGEGGGQAEINFKVIGLAGTAVAASPPARRSAVALGSQVQLWKTWGWGYEGKKKMRVGQGKSCFKAAGAAVAACASPPARRSAVALASQV